MQDNHASAPSYSCTCAWLFACTPSTSCIFYFHMTKLFSNSASTLPSTSCSKSMLRGWHASHERHDLPMSVRWASYTAIHLINRTWIIYPMGLVGWPSALSRRLAVYRHLAQVSQIVFLERLKLDSQCRWSSPTVLRLYA
ncbi:hypothetical protein PENSPDRAFT_206001 [Peniophora sp. CONT]|nr:hypothetical protein PENSPDRAFT_206001 [Peniophora sp. CONT]